MRTGIAATRRSGVPILALLLAIVALGGCAAHRLGQAQEAFSKAAEQENRITQLDAAAMSSYASPFALYQVADAILTEDTRDKAQDLKKENLLATAYALHAMTLWRLADLATLEPASSPEATATAAVSLPRTPEPASAAYRRRAREARDKASDLRDGLGPRDEVMMAVLLHLMDHDSGMHHLAAGNWKRAHDFFDSAHGGIAAAIARAPANHDVRGYLRLAQLQTLAAWDRAIVNGVKDADARDACRRGWILPKFKEAIDGLEAADRPGIIQSPFVRQRLAATGLNAGDVMRSQPTATPCVWK
jgi:hypothetical protein